MVLAEGKENRHTYIYIYISYIYFIWKDSGHRIANAMLKEKNKLTLCKFKTYYKAM